MSETPNNSKPTVMVSADRMSAILTLPPRQDESAISYEQCFKLLQNNQIDITSDVDFALKSLLKKQANAPTIEHNAEIAKGKPVVIINRGPTRGDELATAKVQMSTTDALTYLAEAL